MNNKRFGLALVVIMILLAACGGAAMPAVGDELNGGDQGEGVMGAPEPAMDSDASGQRDAAGEEGGSNLLAQLQSDRQIIKTGQISIEVPDVAVAASEVRTMATALGGYIGGSQAGTLDERATLTLRIPADRFEDALARLREIDGTLLSETTNEEDVTAVAVDLEARLDNLRASETQYRALLERATDIEDVLAVQTRLDGVRGEIEQYQAQLNSLTRQTDMATLTVALVPEPSPITTTSEEWNPGRTVDEALASLLTIGQGLFNGAIWFVIVWLPILLVLSVIALIVLRSLLVARSKLAIPRKDDVE